MSALHEVFQTVALFGLFFIVIPVGIFTADIIKNYYFKEANKHESHMEKHSSHHP
jgi:hypothetical protein